MQHRLPLPPPALEIAGVAVLPNRRHVPRDRPPSPDLPSRRRPSGGPCSSGSTTGTSLADPADGSSRCAATTASDCEALTPKQLRRASWRAAQSFARTNQLAGNSSRQSVMYLPPNTPSSQHLLRRQLGSELRCEVATERLGPVVDVPALHPVMDDDSPPHGTTGPRSAWRVLVSRVTSKPLPLAAASANG